MNWEPSMDPYELRESIGENLEETCQHGDKAFPCAGYRDHYRRGREGYPWHWHDEWEIAFVEQGQVRAQVNGEQHLLGPGEGIFINRRVLHAFSLEGDGEVWMPNLLFLPSLLYGSQESVFWEKYTKPLASSTGCTHLALRQDVPWQREALAQAGHEVKVILPLYEGIGDQWRSQMTFLKYFNVTLSWRQVYCGLFQLEREGVTYWFVDNEYYFKRWQIYGHFDDCERFAYFSRAVVETPGQLDWSPDIIHCNDWQTALIPVYLLEDKYRTPQLNHVKTVFTIHNVEYQGRYGDQVLEDVIGLGRNYFNEGMLAHQGDVNLMKGAIMASTYVTTVSPTYAQELRLPFYAHGMDGVINQQSGKLQGILNGIDMALYDPAVMPGLAANFTPAAPAKGKTACKLALQRKVGLREDESAPIIACVSRLVGHKGFSLVTDVLHQIMEMDVQMVVLGTGDWQYEEAFRNAQRQYPGRFSAQITYSGPLSNMIYAGADLFLMPSVSEPCGLSQMIAMRFGTVPIVRETGGLKDTVLPYNKFTGEGRGFTFSDVNAGDMLWVIREAVDLYYNDKEAWRGLQKAGMTADFSWDHSAQEYLDIYQRISG